MSKKELDPSKMAKLSKSYARLKTLHDKIQKKINKVHKRALNEETALRKQLLEEAKKIIKEDDQPAAKRPKLKTTVEMVIESDDSQSLPGTGLVTYQKLPDQEPAPSNGFDFLDLDDINPPQSVEQAATP